MGVVDPEIMARRYGRRPARPRGALVASLVAAALLLGYVVWYAAETVSRPSLETRNVAVAVVDDATVRLTFHVMTEPGTTAECTARAVNASFAEVGVREVTVGPVTEALTTVTTEITTVEPATSAELVGCSVVEAP